MDFVGDIEKRMSSTGYMYIIGEWVVSYNWRMSCKLGFKHINYCDVIYSRSIIHDSYINLQGNNMYLKVVRRTWTQSKEDSSILS